MNAIQNASLNNILLETENASNIVFRLTDPADFTALIAPMTEHARASLQPVLYLRFSDAKPFLLPSAGIEVETIELNHRFEKFTVAIYHLLLTYPDNTLCIFDCLSELQTAWATDLMMVNFFRVITPLLTGKKCRALFPLLCGRHSLGSADKIAQISDVMLDVYSDFKQIYLRVDSISAGAAPEVFQPHVFKDHAFSVIRDGVKLSRFHKAQDLTMRMAGDLHMDSWDRFFQKAVREFEDGDDMTQSCRRMCAMMMTRDERMRSLIRDSFRPEDFFFIKEHMVGSGLIGGKACGMLTARKLIESRRPDLYEMLESHDSFYIGSDVYYSYIVENGFWDLAVEQRTQNGYFSKAADVRSRLLNGSFSQDFEQQFLRLLDYYGQSPIIVRSSSILEDGFDHAFSGKYDSVFCPNTGSAELRLKAFEDAVRKVYASTISLSALDYRKRHGLEKRDEQMALLVQRVSGSYYGRYFLPCAAGVGYSCSPYRFLPSLDPSAGMLRLVCGLGTSAVDRTEGSYPRLVSLDQPEATPYHSYAQKHRYSQRKISLIDQEKSALVFACAEDVEKILPSFLKKLLYEHDRDAERVFREKGENRDIMFLSCLGIVKREDLMPVMRDVLSTLQEAYHNPVDIEFTMNIDEDGDFVINLLQCRPLQVREGGGSVQIPDSLRILKPFLETKNASMGMSRTERVDGIVYIDPVAYYEMPYRDKPGIARTLGKLNWEMRSAGKVLLLLTPGRIGTSSPELGVPTEFSDISSFRMIAEIAESRAGYRPDLSYGSHIFQDLVEADILYDAVFEDEHTVNFHPGRLKAFPNLIKSVDPAAQENIIGYYDVSGSGCRLFHDMERQHLTVFLDAVQNNMKDTDHEYR